MRNFLQSVLFLNIIVFSFYTFAEEESITQEFSLIDYQESVSTDRVMTPSYIPKGLSAPIEWPISTIKAPTIDEKDNFSSRVIGGNNANRGEFPEYVLVLIANDAGTFTGTCGGTLIAQNKVLTAAHCAQSAADRYLVIPNFYSRNDTLVTNDLYTVNSVVAHPDYNSDSFDSDVAVLTLSRNAPFALGAIHAGSNNFANETGTLIGVGRIQTTPALFADILQKIDHPIVSNSVCSVAWESFELASVTITENMMCAGFANSGDGSCFGDSGGPLWVNIDGQRVIGGTVSFGVVPCELNRQTTVYSRLSKMTDFISQQSPETKFVYSDRDNIILTPIYDLLF